MERVSGILPKYCRNGIFFHFEKALFIHDKKFAALCIAKAGRRFLQMGTDCQGKIIFVV